MIRLPVLINSVTALSIGVILMALGVYYFAKSTSLLVNNNPPANNPSHTMHLSKNVNNSPILDLSLKHIIKDITFNNYQSQFGPLASSLRNTYIPIHFTVTPNGQLVITRSIRSLIEYFLSANTEEPIDMIIGRINEIFDTALSQPARAQAKDVLRRYLDYKQALVIIEQQQSDEQNLSGKVPNYESALKYRKDARMNYLGQEIYDAFFAKEDSLDDYTTGILAINKNHDLSDKQKQQQALALELVLPPEEQAIKTAEHQREELKHTVSKARANGASESQIFQLRSQVYDQQTTERFAARDIQKSKWDNRFTQYRQSRQAILASDGISDDDKASEIEALKTNSFSRREKIRLTTLDKMADKTANP